MQKKLLNEVGAAVAWTEAADCEAIQATLEKSRGVPVFCYVWATWCVPCKRVGPRFESLAEAYAGHAVFVKIDADGCVDFLRARGIKGIPVILALKDDTDLGRLPGEPTVQKIEQFIQERLAGENKHDS